MKLVFSYNKTTFHILLSLLLIGGFFGQYVYIGLKPIHLVRVMFPILTLWGLKNLNFKTTNLGFSIILYYVVFFICTSFTSFIYLRVTSINDYLNFCVATFLPVFLLLFAQENKLRFLKIVFFTTTACFIVYVLVAFYEVVTLNHLRSSTLVGLPKVEWWRHAPTGFYANQNDFASAIALMGFFLITYLRFFTPKKTLWYELAIFIICIWLSFATTARIVQVVLFLIGVVMYRKYIFNPKVILSLSVLLLIMIFIFHEYFANLLVLLQKFNSFEDGSSERIDLFVYGLKSVKDSWGMGFGIKNADMYYIKHGFGILVPHFYQIEVLMTGGIIPLIAWLVMYFMIIRDIILFTPYRELILFPIVYFLLQQSAASVFFNYSFYIIFIAFIAIVEFKKENKNYE